MASEDILYESIFTIFSGFLIFLAIIINKMHQFLAILDSYFVLFLFLGIVLTIIGISMSLLWNFNNRKPYEEAIIIEEKKHFPAYFVSGSIMLLVSFTLRYYFRVNAAYNFLLNAAGISGIILLTAVLYVYINEVIKKTKKKTPQRSGTSI